MIGNMLSEGALELFMREVVCRMALRFLSEIPATAAQDLPELTQMFLSTGDGWLGPEGPVSA